MAHPSQFKFTTRTLTQLPPCPPHTASRATEYTDTDVTGLKIQVNKQGRKTFYWRYVYQGVKRAVKIGDFPATDVADARKRALAMRGLLDQGCDPQAGQDRLKAMPTFAEFVQREYLPMAYQTKRSAKDDASKFRLHLLPRFGPSKLSEITTREIQGYITELTRTLTRATANRHLAVLSRLFKLAVLWGGDREEPLRGGYQVQGGQVP